MICGVSWATITTTTQANKPVSNNKVWELNSGNFLQVSQTCTTSGTGKRKPSGALPWIVVSLAAKNTRQTTNTWNKLEQSWCWWQRPAVPWGSARCCLPWQQSGQVWVEWIASGEGLPWSTYLKALGWLSLYVAGSWSLSSTRAIWVAAWLETQSWALLPGFPPSPRWGRGQARRWEGRPSLVQPVASVYNCWFLWSFFLSTHLTHEWLLRLNVRSTFHISQGLYVRSFGWEVDLPDNPVYF